MVHKESDAVNKAGKLYVLPKTGDGWTSAGNKPASNVMPIFDALRRSWQEVELTMIAAAMHGWEGEGRHELVTGQHLRCAPPPPAGTRAVSRASGSRRWDAPRASSGWSSGTLQVLAHTRLIEPAPHRAPPCHDEGARRPAHRRRLLCPSQPPSLGALSPALPSRYEFPLVPVALREDIVLHGFLVDVSEEGDTSETPPRHLRDASETPPRRLRDTSETPPRRPSAGASARRRVLEAGGCFAAPRTRGCAGWAGVGGGE